jgi:SAM-dependent methyltransferase
LQDHTYVARLEQTAEILGRHLEAKIGNNRLPDPDFARVSYAQQPITAHQVTFELAHSWRSEDIPLKQRSLVQRELAEMYGGHPPRVFQVLSDALKPYIKPGIGLLEVGCASGYYYEVLEYLLNTRLSYVGIDFSEAMIRMARLYYPSVRFEVGDGAALRFDNRSVPIVISSCVLLHVQAYAMHIAEAARVASEIVVFHRTPVSRMTPTSHYKKFAYDVETYELRFHEAEILQLCSQNGLELIAALTYDEHPERDEFGTTYVFRVARTV